MTGTRYAHGTVRSLARFTLEYTRRWLSRLRWRDDRSERCGYSRSWIDGTELFFSTYFRCPQRVPQNIFPGDEPTLFSRFSQIADGLPGTSYVYFRVWKSRSNHNALHSAPSPCNYQSSYHTRIHRSTSSPAHQSSTTVLILLLFRNGFSTGGVSNDWRPLCKNILLTALRCTIAFFFYRR